MKKSADKRTISTDALETLGTIITEHAGRDAIHVAVEPCQAKEKLYPGQDVSKDGSSQPATDHVGIVDPFLKGPVFEGQWFWLLLYPRTITSLRHVWSHPKFDGATEEPVASGKSASELWLTDFADEFDLTLNALLKAARTWILEQDYYVLRTDTPDRAYRDNEEFWKHYEIYTGETVEEDKRETFFTCSC